jgi:hypothetical protein
MKNIYIFRKPICLFLFVFFVMNLGWGQYSGTGTFNKITSLTDLTDGYYVIVNSGDQFAMNNSYISSTYLDRTSVSPSSNTLTNPATSIVWKIETNGTGRSIYNESTAKYVSYLGSSNNVQVVSSVTADNQRWTFTYSSSIFSVANVAVTTRILQYNSSSPRFACYTSAQQKFLLYKLAPSATPPTLINPTVSSITTTSATLGATVSSNGGAALTARGTVLGTSASPTGNALAEGSTAVAAFTHSRTSLTPNTLYTYRGYAINSAGTGYSADGTFTTLPLAPTVGLGNSITSSGFTANWSHPTMGSASYTYTVEVDDDNAFGSINSTVSSIASSNTSQAITGLSPSTTYYYRVKADNAQGSSVWSATSTGVTTSIISSNNCPNGVSVSPTADQDSCENATLKLISANPSYSGGTGTPTVQYQWYYNTTNSNTISGATSVSGATNASFTPPTTTSDVGTRYYFCVAYAVDNSCAQSSTTQSLASITVKVVVNGIPAAPTGAASQSMCSGQTVSNLNATGTTIKWYSAASGGSALNSSSSLSSTDYYASQTVNGCESSNRLAVAAIVNSIPSAPTGSASQTFCSGNTVANLSATGTAIRWYSAASGGSALNSASALSSTNYFASQTVNGCESSNRFQVAATINSISIPTNIVASNATCSSFDLAWDAVNCASGYKLDVGDNKDFLSKNIVSWDFPNSPDNAIADGGIAANNTKSITVGGGVTGLNFAAGGATTNSANATGWDVGNGTKYWEVNFTTLGFYNIRISSKQRGSNTAPRDFKLQYKIGLSGTYTDVPSSNITVANNYTTGVISQLALPNVCDNQTSVYLRWIMTSNTSVNGSSVAIAGSGNIDDILVEGLSPNYLSGYQDLSVSSTSKTVSGLSPNTKYYYRVRSTDGTNTSASSNVDSFTTPALSLTTSGTVSPICFNAANTSSLSYTAATDNPNSYSIDWNNAANTAGLNDQTATSFTSNTSGGTISTIAIPSNVAAGNYSGVMTLTNAAGCSITKNVSLTISPLPTVSISAAPMNAIVCQGSNVTLTATAGLSSYAWSSGTSTNNTATFSPTATTTYTVTTTDGNGCINSASQTVNYYPASSYVGLATSNVSGAVEQCTESNGWTYYAHPSNPSQYLFGIHKNGNTFTATVDINIDNANKFRKSTSSNGANQEHASYIMSRYWNANITSGSIASNSNVKVRFFIAPQDIIDLQNARDNDYNKLKDTTNPNTLAVKTGTEYFKTVGTTYNPANWNGNTHNGTIVKLTEDAVGTLNGQTYVELSGITSFSGGSIGAAFGPSSNGFFNNNGVVGLPVTWNQVDVNVLEQGNELNWSTSSEQNTSHFEVEYSEDAVQFYNASENISAAGNSSITQQYQFLHENEVRPWLYYRIKQVDLDGKIDYSKIVIAKRATKLPDFKVAIYPIPLIEGELKLDIHSIAQTEIQIRVIDLLGKEVYREKIASKGYRTMHQLQLDHLPKGQYQIQVDNSVFSHQQRLVLLK